MKAIQPGGPLILVAEDDEITQLIIQRAFLKACSQCDLRFVQDGDEALLYLQGNHQFADRNLNPFPSLLLLDLKMPRKDGFQVLEEIRLNLKILSLIIIVFSSSDDQADIDHAYDLGANSYLIKSSLYEQLVEIVKELEQYWTKRNRLPSSRENAFKADDAS
jgi:CheY-like chemotaxis protein